MNTFDAWQKAQKTIDENRRNAELKAESVVLALCKNADYVANEKQLRTAQVTHALANGQQKIQAQQTIEKCTAKQAELLKKYGYKPSDLQPHYLCKKCNDTGHIGEKRCTCLQNEFRKVLFAESNLSNANCTFANSTATEKHTKAVYKQAEKVCETNQNILLCGKTGTGKTYLLLACANKCIALGKSVLFLTSYALNNAFLQAHLAPLENKLACLSALTNVDVLVIDDLGGENIYQNVTAEYLFDVLNERENNNKQTFISTNLSLQELRFRYDERIFSRLVNQKRTFVAELSATDNRLTKH